MVSPTTTPSSAASHTPQLRLLLILESPRTLSRSNNSRIRHTRRFGINETGRRSETLGRGGDQPAEGQAIKTRIKRRRGRPCQRCLRCLEGHLKWMNRAPAGPSGQKPASQLRHGDRYDTETNELTNDRIRISNSKFSKQTRDSIHSLLCFLVFIFISIFFFCSGVAGRDRFVCCSL